MSDVILRGVSYNGTSRLDVVRIKIEVQVGFLMLITLATKCIETR